jgi:hypothetical protein
VSTTDRLTPQDLIDQWRLHPDPEVGSCANQLAGWLRTQEEEKDSARFRLRADAELPATALTTEGK